ncbi:hypothetical protein [Bradyrhizobium sp. BWA-3-5]|uniref:hypothetical protein n=1 Tax=Bradyrhizobium sp. BWA-3-5 TaxID=3080013 RepID=UPI00293F6253|nr:hypothetical protein [Bradyrhizobium sp. BWA-3-5]WOH63051.1 hypothetical protein RX331_20145 [Bradyrhizobium sp. BWA-3-5]
MRRIEHNAKAQTARSGQPVKPANQGRSGLKQTCRNGPKTLASTGKISMLQPETASTAEGRLCPDLAAGPKIQENKL